MAYPATKETFTDPSASDPRNSPSHAGLHTSINGVVEAIQDTIGTTAGTSIARNFAAGDFAARINGSNVLQQAISGTLNNSTQGTPRITGGTASAFIVGTSTVQGGTVANAVVGTSQIQGGTLANNAIGTPTFLAGTLVVSGTTVTFQPGASLAPAVGTMTDAPSGTIAINAPSAQIQELTMGTTAGNRTLGTPSNPINGQFLGFRFKQNTNNTGTIVYPAIYRFVVSGTPILGTQSTWNYVGFRYNSTDTKWDHQGNSLGLI